MKMIFLIFISFFKIGAFTLGGGYAMIPLIRDEIIFRKKWIDEEEFIDLLAISQVSPGPVAVNVSVFVGYKIKGFIGAVFATLGCILPSFFILLIIAINFPGVKNNTLVVNSFNAVKPAVLALIASTAFDVSKKIQLNLINVATIILVVYLIIFLKINPILIILISIIISYIKYKRMI